MPLTLGLPAMQAAHLANNLQSITSLPCDMYMQEIGGALARLLYLIKQTQSKLDLSSCISKL